MYKFWSFHWKTQTTSWVKLKTLDLVFTDVPTTQYLSKLKPYVSFMELFSNFSQKWCLIYKKSKTTQKATVPKWTLRYIESPVTTVHRHQCRNIDLKTLIYSVTRTYRPDIWTNWYWLSRYDANNQIIGNKQDTFSTLIWSIRHI